MKTTFTIIAMLALTSTATAQPTAPASATSAPAATPKPAKKPGSHFHNRIDQIKEDTKNLPADTTGTVVMLGDSITEGFFKSNEMPPTIAGFPVMNHGISGDQIDRPTSGTGVTTRVDLVKNAKPAVVFVLIGVNDFWGGKETPEEVLPQYEKMFRMLKQAAPDAKFVWQSVLPTSMKHAHLNPSVDKLNARIKELATAVGDTYLDLHPAMADDKGELKAEFTGDGVHLKPAAYKVWLEKLEATVAEQLK